MKRFLFSAALAMGVFAAQAQITLEKTYTGRGLTPFKLSTGEVKYAEVQLKDSQIRVYNQNHSLWKTVPTPSVTGEFDYIDIENMSDQLFDADAGLEFLLLVSNSEGRAVYVLDESGATLLKVADSGYAEVFGTPNGAKLFVYGSAAEVDFTKVYALPGTGPVLKSLGAADSQLAGAFPNPAAELVNLPYAVAAGQQATLEVLDLTGRVVSTHQVQGGRPHLALATGRLRSGAYLYRVTDAAGATTVGRRFVVTH